MANDWDGRLARKAMEGRVGKSCFPPARAGLSPTTLVLAPSMDYGIGMGAARRGWTVFDAQTPVLTYRYSFGPGAATSLAVGGANGLVIVSPPCRVAPSVFTDLSQYGVVRALVASNAFHHLGLRE